MFFASSRFIQYKFFRREGSKQIKEKGRIPNPSRAGEVCKIVAKNDPELKQVSGCWCIIVEVKTHSCAVRLWRMDFYTVKPEYLEPIDEACEKKAMQVCDRIRRLADKVYE